MERIRTILKSGVHNINLVAPDRRCTSRFRTELMKSSYKGLVIEETENLKADRKWCDLVVFSPNDEDLVSSLILLERIICPHGLSGSQARRLYETLARSALSPVCAKTIMREHRTGTFYRTREILASFASCGLFIPVASADRKLYLILAECIINLYLLISPSIISWTSTLLVIPVIEIQGSIFKLIRPDKVVSVSFDETDNIFAFLDFRCVQNRRGAGIFIRRDIPATDFCGATCEQDGTDYRHAESILEKLSHIHLPVKVVINRQYRCSLTDLLSVIVEAIPSIT